MKKGDTLPVTIEGIKVADAVVEHVEADRVTLLIPGTRAVVGVRVSLSDTTPTPEKETVIDGTHTPETEQTPEVAPSTDVTGTGTTDNTNTTATEVSSDAE